MPLGMVFFYCPLWKACKRNTCIERHTLNFVSRIATLPGEEDVAGLQALLDPNTLEGRAARIALLTRGSGPLSLATRGDVPFDHKERPVTAVSGRSGGLLMA